MNLKKNEASQGDVGKVRLAFFILQGAFFNMQGADQVSARRTF